MSLQLDIERPCAWEEHSRRIENVRREMGKSQLDLLLVTSLHSIYYLFGVDRMSGAGIFQCVVLSAERPPVAVVFALNELLFQQSPLLGDIRTWSKGVKEATELLGQALSEFPGSLRIGVEKGDSTLPPAVYEPINQQLRKREAEVLDASSLVTRLRMIKSPAEIRCVRRAASLLDTLFSAAFEAMRPGARECDVAAAAIHATYTAGGEHCIHPPLISTGVNTLLNTFHGPSRRVFRRGDLIGLETGANFHRYHVVGAHTAICASEPTTEQLDYYATARASIDRAMSVIKPGVSMATLFSSMKDGRPDGSCAAYATGLGFGDVWYEAWPLEDNWTLEPGTLISIFGKAVKKDEYVMLSVVPILITDDGFDVLTEIDGSQLRVVGR